MINPEFFFNTLSKQGVEFFTGVPDSLLKNFGNFITSQLSPNNHIIATNEGAAVGLGIGHHLATGKTPVIYMQNSGLGNAFNPLVSLSDPTIYGIPMILLIGWRGEPGIKDEPQHNKQGPITLATLSSMGIKTAHISNKNTYEEIELIVNHAIEDCQIKQRPYALVISKDTFTDYVSMQEDNDIFLKREQAIKTLLPFIHYRDVIIATTGMISRELYEQREVKYESHHQDFLVVGGMGHSVAIALRIAQEKPTHTIFCLDGDGSILMHMGSLAMAGTSQCSNFKHIVLNNGVHDSVGGQPTVGLNINLPDIAGACGYSHTYSVDNQTQLESVLPNFMQKKGPNFLQIVVRPGHRKNLGRPKQSPAEYKKQFMHHLTHN